MSSKTSSATRTARLRRRQQIIAMAIGPAFLLGGCGLNDQQLTQIWQSVVTTALNTVVSAAIDSAATPPE
jgi:hypothetical protein